MAFENIKRELSMTPVLCAFDIAKLHRVSADSSKNAIGAVFLLRNDQRDWQPVEYASRKLTETEQRICDDRERESGDNMGVRKV